MISNIFRKRKIRTREMYGSIMNISTLTFILFFNISAGITVVSGQQRTDTLGHSRESSIYEISFTRGEASAYLSGFLTQPATGGRSHDTLRLSIARLLSQYDEPFDSVRSRLRHYPYARLDQRGGPFLKHDTLPLRWLVNGYFYVDTIPLYRSPVITQTKVFLRPRELPEPRHDTTDQFWNNGSDTGYFYSDTLTEEVIDTAYLRSRKVTLHRMVSGVVIPPLTESDTLKRVEMMPDGSAVVITTRCLQADAHGARQTDVGEQPGWRDSLEMATAVLLDYLLLRDSILIYIQDIDGQERPLWITGGRDDYFRFWARNRFNDSITIWIGNPEHHTLSLRLEEGIHVKVPEKIDSDDLVIGGILPDKSLEKVPPLEEIPFSWNFGVNSSLSVNQNYLSNWAKGGASSLSTLLDITGQANYRNRKTREKFENNARMRYGSIRTKEQGFRTSNDILEFNSQYNRVFREKIDFSALMYFKSQVARGFKYPNDSVVVSKFLNPGSFTVGVGFEYKPFRHTSLNFSPFSYKTTFVLDTAQINPTNHGVEAGERVRQEFGGQLLIKNDMKLLEGLKMTHNIRLFSNYLNEPQNIDVDWEMGLEKEINWYFTIKLNLHVIYDDDIMLPLTDEEGNPVLWPDGTPRKGPRTQLNQFLGLTLTFKL